jgi:hypothetical protein
MNSYIVVLPIAALRLVGGKGQVPYGQLPLNSVRAGRQQR